jgi:hypothetical protein
MARSRSPFERRDVRRVQQRLRLPRRQPVAHADANGLGALHAADAGSEFGRQEAVVGCLGGKPPDGGHSNNDRTRPEPAGFQGYAQRGIRATR